MKKIAFVSLIVLLLSACAPALTPSPSTNGRGESPTPAATRTPIPPTATATVTPMPQLTREDLKSMSVEDKLKMAPQVETAPEDVVSSFAAGESARDIAWSGKSLTFWDRVVAYEGTTRSGEKVTLYYDLESGQWAKQYQNFDEVSKIPADEVPDVMVMGDQLIRNKEQFNYTWINQPRSVTEDGRMIIFRNSELDPITVWDKVEKKWLTPEEAGVVWTTEVWKQKLSEPATKLNGKTYIPLDNFKKYTSGIFVTSAEEVLELQEGVPFLILQPSGIMVVGSDREYVVERMKAGATIMRDSNEHVMSSLEFIYDAVQFANSLYNNGEREVRVELGKFRAPLEYNQSSFLWIKDILTLTLDDGTVVTPILGMPTAGNIRVGNKSVNEISLEDAGIIEINEKNWLDKIIKAGYITIVFYPK